MRPGQALAAALLPSASVLRRASAFRSSALHAAAASRHLRRFDRPGRIALRRRGCKPFVKHNRRWGRSRGAEIFGGGAAAIANTVLKVGRAGVSRATTLDCRCARALRRCAVDGRIDAGAENIAVDGPGAAEHNAPRRLRCRGNAGEWLAGKISCGYGPQGQTHRYSYSFALRPEQLHSTPLDAARKKFPGSISQRRGASLRRVLVKCGLNAGRCAACANGWNLSDKFTPYSCGPSRIDATFSKRGADTSPCRGPRAWCREWSTADRNRAHRADPGRGRRSPVPFRRTRNGGCVPSRRVNTL